MLKTALWRADPREYFRLFPSETRVIERMMNDDCLLLVFKFLSTHETGNSKLVCKRWNRVAQNEQIWKKEYDERFGGLSAKISGTYKTFFEREGRKNKTEFYII